LNIGNLLDEWQEKPDRYREKGKLATDIARPAAGEHLLDLIEKNW